MRHVLVFLALTGGWLSVEAQPLRDFFQDGTPRATVIIFIGLDCPVSQKYISRLNELYSRYEKDVSIQAYVPQPVKQSQLRRFKKEYKVRFDLVADAHLAIVSKTKATITPEVFVYKGDPSDLQQYVYRGAIDNWFYELGRYRPVVTEHYLAEALDAILQGMEPARKETEAIGCFIQFPEKKVAHDHVH
jgi:hypothetical protein